MLLHGLQQIKQMPSTPAAVAVHSGYACGWKKCSNLLFNALSAKPAACYLGGTARRTNRVWTLMKATVVAEELIAAAVQGKGNMTVPALQHMATILTLHKGGESAPVEIEQGLLALIQVLPHGAEQGAGKKLMFPWKCFRLHIHNLHLRQRMRAHPFRQLQ